jgi:hypothetical protein
MVRGKAVRKREEKEGQEIKALNHKQSTKASQHRKIE